MIRFLRRALLVAFVLSLISASGVGSVDRVEAKAKAPRVVVFESDNVSNKSAMDRLDQIAHMAPGAEVVNYSLQWGTKADRIAYYNGADDRGLCVDPVLYDYVVTDQSKGLAFVQEAKDNKFRGICRWLVLDEAVSLEQVTAFKMGTAAEKLSDKEARAQLETLDDSLGLVTKYVALATKFYHQIKKLDSKHSSWGVFECYVSDADQASTLATSIKVLLPAMDNAGCDSYTSDTTAVGFAAQALRLAVGDKVVPTFVIQVTSLDVNPVTPSAETMMAQIEAIKAIEPKGSMQVGVYSYLDLVPAADKDADLVPATGEASKQIEAIRQVLVDEKLTAA